MEIKTCTRCVMNNFSDSTISFDDFGRCNYCNEALRVKDSIYFPNQEGKGRLESLITEIKAEEINRKYDCIMGLSGGLDSSYLAYLGYKYGLRVLAVHVDDGFDTEISKQNLNKIIEKTGFAYEVIKPDALQYYNLILAYMKAGVPNIAIPQDNILFAFIYNKMRKFHLNYFLSGGNFALESILQRGNSYKSTDVVQIKDINRKNGNQPINKLKFISTTQRIFDSKFFGIKTLRPLNFIDYNRDRAFKELNSFCGFQYYGGKHLENILTAFIQLYWLPIKFGVDKRTSHLSSLIVSGQLSRDEALEELKKPLYDEKIMGNYISLILDKLSINEDLFQSIMNAPNHQHEDFDKENNTVCFKILKRFQKTIQIRDL